MLYNPGQEVVYPGSAEPSRGRDSYASYTAGSADYTNTVTSGTPDMPGLHDKTLDEYASSQEDGDAGNANGLGRPVRNLA